MFSIVIILAIVASALFFVVAIFERLMISWHAWRRN
jgi:hypothetical protein